jgi:hypothetical protein
VDWPATVVVRKNSIRLPSDRDVSTYLFGFAALENPRSQPPPGRKHFSAGLTVNHLAYLWQYGQPRTIRVLNGFKLLVLIERENAGRLDKACLGVLSLGGA